MEYEILAPAGDLERAKIAINSGANAIYLGLSAFSARASAVNFTNDDLLETLQYAKLFTVSLLNFLSAKSNIAIKISCS
jgi:putative protease